MLCMRMFKSIAVYSCKSTPLECQQVMHLSLQPRSTSSRRPKKVWAELDRNICTVPSKAPPKISYTNTVRIVLIWHADMCVLASACYKHCCLLLYNYFPLVVSRTVDFTKDYARLKLIEVCHAVVLWIGQPSEPLSISLHTSQAAVIDLMQRRRLPTDAMDCLKPLLDPEVLCAGRCPWLILIGVQIIIALTPCSGLACTRDDCNCEAKRGGRDFDHDVARGAPPAGHGGRKGWMTAQSFAQQMCASRNRQKWGAEINRKKWISNTKAMSSMLSLYWILWISYSHYVVSYVVCMSMCRNQASINHSTDLP